MLSLISDTDHLTAPPPQPENVTLVDVTSNGAEMAWDKPHNHKYFNIKGYVIEYWVFSASKNKMQTDTVLAQRSQITGEI
jgi:hypothetical protein